MHFRYLIQFTEDEDAEMWKGYMFAALFFVSAVINSFFFHQLFHIGMTLGMRIKAVVIAAVYEKVHGITHVVVSLTQISVCVL